MRQMLAIGGNTPQLYILLGQAYNEQGETAKALEELQLALSLDSKTPMAHYYSGLIHIKAGKFDEAGKEFQRDFPPAPRPPPAQHPPPPPPPPPPTPLPPPQPP